MSGDPSGAEQAWRDALGYHRSARRFQESDAAASVVFNVAAMGLERYLMAVCYRFGVEPVHHTFGSMMSEVEALTDVPADLGEQVASVDEVFGICSLDDYHHGEPEDEDVRAILDSCDRLEEFFGSTVTRSAAQ